MAKKILKEGPIRYSLPLKKKEPPKICDYEKYCPQQPKPNMVKMGVNIGEEKIPAEAKAPNHKKYDSKGRYVKHKPVLKDKILDNPAGEASNRIMKAMSMSNPHKGRKSGFQDS